MEVVAVPVVVLVVLVVLPVVVAVVVLVVVVYFVLLLFVVLIDAVNISKGILTFSCLKRYSDYWSVILSRTSIV